MTTHSIEPSDQPGLPRASVLSVIFLMLGAPHLYAFLNRSKNETRSPSVVRYAMMALGAGAIASLVELSMF